MKKNMILAAALAAVVGLAGVSQAVPTSVILTSGDLVGNSGWRVTFSPGISLTYDEGLSTGPELVLEKAADFQSDEGLDIAFTQVSYSASPTISITDETLFNQSGSNWGGFQFLLRDFDNGLTSPSFGSGPAFAGSTPPFGSQADTSNTITLGSGNLADGGTTQWGYGPTGGELTINGAPSTSGIKQVFTLKEIPVVAAVPLPAAGWTGLSGLLGLGLIAGARRVRRLMA